MWGCQSMAQSGKGSLAFILSKFFRAEVKAFEPFKLVKESFSCPY